MNGQIQQYSPEEMAACAAALEYTVPSIAIAPLRRWAAEWGAKWAADRIGGPVPECRFFRPSPETNIIFGAAELGGQMIVVRSDLAPFETAGTAAHETLHTLGSADESQCREIGRQAADAWKTYRSKQRNWLGEQYDRHRRMWLALPQTPGFAEKRVETLCSVMGVHPFQGELAAEELELRVEELEWLGWSFNVRRAS